MCVCVCAGNRSCRRKHENRLAIIFSLPINMLFFFIFFCVGQKNVHLEDEQQLSSEPSGREEAKALLMLSATSSGMANDC